MSLGYKLLWLQLGDLPQKQGMSWEYRFSGKSCRGYNFAWVRVIQLPLVTTWSQYLFIIVGVSKEKSQD